MSQQNIYDDKEFFNGYLKIRDKPLNYNELIEAPYIYTLLNKTYPNVLDLGCGFGFYSLYLAKKGSKVVAIDISSKMIEEAKKINSHPNIIYKQSIIEEFSYKGNNLDLVISTLAFHYIKDLDPVIKKICNLLKVKGEFIFSIEHPATRASRKVAWIYEDDKKYWPISDYFIRGKRIEKWIINNVEKYHRTISDYFYLLKDNGFSISDIQESEPKGEVRDLLPNSVHRPAFMIFKAIKK